MKIIAITPRITIDSKTQEERDALDVNWSKLIETLSFVPLILPTKSDFLKYFKNFNIHGVILSGGNDLYSVNQNDVSKKRDSFEKNILKYSIKNRIPVVGICRGMQLMCDYFNGNVVEIANHVATTHSIIPSTDSKYSKFLKKISLVNSYHNWGIKNVPTDFIASAQSPDGFVEAMEHKYYKLWGQMWHPERENPFEINNINLLKNFFK